jgi:hypothetical protein
MFDIYRISLITPNKQGSISCRLFCDVSVARLQTVEWYYPCIRLEELGKTRKTSVTIDDILAEIQKEHLPSKSVKLCVPARF